MDIEINMLYDPGYEEEQTAYIKENAVEIDQFRKERVTTLDELERVFEALATSELWGYEGYHFLLLIEQLHHEYKYYPLEEVLPDFWEYRIALNYDGIKLQKVFFDRCFEYKFESAREAHVHLNSTEKMFDPSKECSVANYSVDLITCKGEMQKIEEYAFEKGIQLETARTWVKRAKFPMAVLSGKNWLIPATASLPVRVKNFSSRLFRWSQTNAIDWPMEIVIHSRSGNMESFGRYPGTALFSEDVNDHNCVILEMNVISVDAKTLIQYSNQFKIMLKKDEALKLMLFFIACPDMRYCEKNGDLSRIRCGLERHVFRATKKLIKLESI